MTWVPANVPHPSHLCARTDCDELRFLDEAKGQVRRWCKRHCQERHAQILAAGGLEGRVYDLFIIDDPWRDQ